MSGYGDHLNAMTGYLDAAGRYLGSEPHPDWVEVTSFGGPSQWLDELGRLVTETDAPGGYAVPHTGPTNPYRTMILAEGNKTVEPTCTVARTEWSIEQSRASYVAGTITWWEMEDEIWEALNGTIPHRVLPLGPPPGFAVGGLV